MRWEDERYIRLYTRDTPGWVYLGWEAQALFMQLLRKVDRAGVIDLGKSGARGLAALLRMPEDVTSRALSALLEDGCVEQLGTRLVVPNFIEAQESSMSPTARQKESRERRRDLIRSGLDPDLRATVIYFVQSEHGGPVKIGRADDLAKRLQGLATGRPDNLVVLGAVPGTVEDERRVHQALAPYREKGEWFSASPMVMACALAAVPGATVEDVLRHAWGPAAVTNRDGRHVTCHETYTVTPSLALPNQEPERDPASAGSEPDGSGVPRSETSPSTPNGPPASMAPAPDPSQPNDLEPPPETKKQQTLKLVEPKPKGDSPAAAVFAVYVDGWRRTVGGTRPPVLDDKRRRLVNARLQTFSREDLEAACRGIWLSQWHVDNRQCAFELIMRDAEHVERFMAMTEARPVAKASREAAGLIRHDLDDYALPMMNANGVRQ